MGHIYESAQIIHNHCTLLQKTKKKHIRGLKISGGMGGGGEGVDKGAVLECRGGDCI